MKFQCRCGELIIDSDFNRRYVWSTRVDHEQFLDQVDQEIEQLSSLTDCAKEARQMAVRYADPSQSVWQCPFCHRLITFLDNEPVFLIREAE